MSNTFRASRDIIVRTKNWSEALKFYGSVLGLPITEKGGTIHGSRPRQRKSLRDDQRQMVRRNTWTYECRRTKVV